MLKPGDMKTTDHKPERYGSCLSLAVHLTNSISYLGRLNVHVDEDGTVHDVTYG